MSLLALKNKWEGCCRTLMAADPGFISLFLQRQGCARHWPVLATDARHAPRSGDTVGHQGSSLPAASDLEICSNRLPHLAVGSFEGCGCCGK